MVKIWSFLDKVVTGVKKITKKQAKILMIHFE